MLINILKSKIHRATVTEARVDYVGSITIDSFLMKKAGIIPYEKVMVVSIDSGQRLETVSYTHLDVYKRQSPGPGKYLVFFESGHPGAMVCE